ncbi:N-acetylneuraminate synthase family protein [Rufibacter sediminis]|uniref:N-acetylneuraminate synthase family protein n=1 Tax=Rufibacter sediminis TaxID=2762756 RepID=A0ABR6VN45_9BACT|nr:N-acetylneuraminate synthase family protein [Rufibacter sediminis]MBC3538508.1 N-acetylneuraminate synthase family protein [Rufibacter sediminis]
MNKVEVIVEIGQAHDGSLGILHSYIDAVASSGADVIKFQTHIAEAESSLQEPFRVKFSYEDETRFDYWKRMEFTISQWEEIKNHCELVGLEFMSSPFSLAAVDLLENLNVNRYKIASGEINNLLMLEKIARTGKPIILSSGMSSFSELEKTIEFLKPFGNELSIMQCTTAYPTAPEQVGLNVIKLMQEKFRLMTGLSDHSGTIFPSLAAVTLGASLIEVHAVFHKKIFGPDTIASLTIEELTELVKGVRFISKAIDNPIDKNENGQFVELKKIFEKTLAVNKNLTVGHILTQDDLESKKPTNCGLPVSDFKRVIGRKLKKSLNRYDFLKKEDLENE